MGVRIATLTFRIAPGVRETLLIATQQPRAIARMEVLIRDYCGRKRIPSKEKRATKIRE